MTDTIDLNHNVSGRAVPGNLSLQQANPADPADLIVRIPEAEMPLVEEAVVAARVAVGKLKHQGIEQRSDALAQIARMLIAERDRLAVLIARETGKVLGDAAGEVVRAARIFDFFAGEALRNIGERFTSVRPGVGVEVDFAPVGVVALITPWNFPIAIPAWKIAPALAFGNGVIWKPSELASAVAVALFEIIARSGLPAESVNLILGGAAAGGRLISAEGIDAISFTGSERTGRIVREAALASGAKVQTEMGGVNGVIILADADLHNAVETVVNGAFFAAGQRCTATSRIIVEEPIAEALLSRLTDRMSTLKVGDPRSAGTVIGPLASMAQKARIGDQVRAIEATGHGAHIGGSALQMDHAYFPPTLFVDPPVDSALTHEEIFGPVAALFRAPDFDAAINILNANRFGLSAGICTRSMLYAERFKADARAGMLMINLPTAGVDYHAPFGGLAASSYGPREQGRLAREFYTNARTIYQLPL